LVDGRAVSQGRGLRGSPLAFLTLGPLRLCRRGPGGRRWASPVAAFRGVFSRGAAAVRLRLLFPGRGSLETVLLRGPPLLVGGGCRWPRRPPPAAAAPRGSPPPAPSSPAGDHRPSGSAPSSLSSSAGRHLILGGGSPRPLLPPWTATAPRGRLPSTPPSPRGGGGCPRPRHPPPDGGGSPRPLLPPWTALLLRGGYPQPRPFRVMGEDALDPAILRLMGEELFDPCRRPVRPGRRLALPPVPVPWLMRPGQGLGPSRLMEKPEEPDGPPKARNAEPPGTVRFE
jgi:hypothetical protein